MAQVTQKFIARKLGLSQPAVAFALSSDLAAQQQLRPETRQRIVTAARQLGYVPHRAARSLRRGKTHTIVLGTLQSLQYAFVHDLFEQIELALTRHGYHLDLELLAHAKDPAAAYQSYTAGRCDGIIAIGLNEPIRQQVAGMRRNGQPVVAIDLNPDPDFDTVCCDQVEAYRLGTAHLLQQGHERIALVLDTGEHLGRQLRLEGYHHALGEAGRPRDDSLLFPWQVGVDPAALWQQIAARQPRPTAILCYNVELAAMLLGTIRRQGVRVPAEVALVTDGNAQLNTLVEVPMTGIDRNHRGVAAAVIDRLLAQMRDPQTSPQQILVKPALVVRASSEETIGSRGAAAAGNTTASDRKGSNQ